jgi:hypothetical protein
MQIPHRRRTDPQPDPDPADVPADTPDPDPDHGHTVTFHVGYPGNLSGITAVCSCGEFTAQLPDGVDARTLARKVGEHIAPYFDEMHEEHHYTVAMGPIQHIPLSGLLDHAMEMAPAEVVEDQVHRIRSWILNSYGANPVDLLLAWQDEIVRLEHEAQPDVAQSDTKVVVSALLADSYRNLLRGWLGEEREREPFPDSFRPPQPAESADSAGPFPEAPQPEAPQPPSP